MIILKWIYIRAVALAHLLGEDSQEMFIEEISCETPELWWLIQLRWWGGLCWGHHYWNGFAEVQQ